MSEAGKRPLSFAAATRLAGGHRDSHQDKAVYLELIVFCFVLAFREESLEVRQGQELCCGEGHSLGFPQMHVCREGISTAKRRLHKRC